MLWSGVRWASVRAGAGDGHGNAGWCLGRGVAGARVGGHGLGAVAGCLGAFVSRICAVRTAWALWTGVGFSAVTLRIKSSS